MRVMGIALKKPAADTWAMLYFGALLCVSTVEKRETSDLPTS